MVDITIDNAVKRFGRVLAVDSVSLRIKKGELFFLLGPSGCGKTTLLRMIAGFYAPQSGRILFDDRDMANIPPYQRHTGMVFQNYALWPHMTVRQNLTFGLEMHHVPAGQLRLRADNALQMVQMQELADRHPNQLSGGQQQRVALARALVLEPDVVLLDEPLSNLDAKLRLEMRAQIKRLHQDLGLTMIYVTHDQAEALSMANRMAVMHNGRVCQIGSPRQVYHRPQNRFVAEFIGQTNFLSGKVSALGEHITVETAAGILISSLACEGIKLGDQVICSIRPEKLGVLNGTTCRPNILTGKVMHTFFLGDHEQYLIRTKDGMYLKALEYCETKLVTDTSQTIRLGCEPSEVVVLRSDDGSTR